MSDISDDFMTAAKAWWVFILAGVCWLVFAFVLLSFTITTVWTVAVFAGIGFLMGGVVELFVASQVDSWRWLHGAAAAIRRASEGGRVPGFGHFLYPQGDPRAAALLARVRALPAPARLISVVDEIATLVAEAHDVAPNVDYAVAALGHVSGMAPDAGDAVFAIARSAGWIAHAIEELRERPVRYRTRAVPPRP